MNQRVTAVAVEAPDTTIDAPGVVRPTFSTELLRIVDEARAKHQPRPLADKRELRRPQFDLD
jgi:hypothetical protein